MPGFTGGITEELPADPRSSEQNKGSTKNLAVVKNVRWERSNENHPSGELPREPLPAGPIFWLRCHICAATQADPTVTLYLNYMQSTANQAYMLHTL